MKYNYNDIKREISGFGGSYEATCRAMALAGIRYLDDHPNLDPDFTQYRNIQGIIKEDNQDAKDLVKVMLIAANNDATGGMVQATVNHVLYVKENGWDKYVATMNLPDKDKK